MQNKITRRFVKTVPWTMLDATVNIIYGASIIMLMGRLLSPSDVGLGSLVLAISQTVESLTTLGIQEAIIRGRSNDTKVTDTAYLLVLCGAFFGIVICNALAFPLAILFAKPLIPALLSVCSITLLTNALASVPTAVLARKMRASALTQRFLFGKISGLIVMAITGLLGLGPWSIVLTMLSVSLGSLLSLIVTCNRWPRLRYEADSAGRLIKFGSVIAAESFTWIATTKLFTLFFGYFHGMQALGYFQFSQRMVDEVALLLQSSFNRLGLALFSSLERDGHDQGYFFLKSTRILFSIAAPCYFGFALVAHDFIKTLFGERWLEAVGMIQVLAVAWALNFPRVLLPQILKAKGRPEEIFKFGVLKSLFLIVIGFLSGGLAPIYGCLAWASGMLLGIPWSVCQVKKHLNIDLKGQVLEMIPSCISVTVMVAVILMIRPNLTNMSPAASLAATVAIGSTIYFFALICTDRYLRKWLWAACSGIRIVFPR